MTPPMSSNRPITPKQARGCTSMKYSIATTRSISSHSIEHANISIPDTNNILYIRSLSILEAYLDTLLTLDNSSIRSLCIEAGISSIVNRADCRPIYQ